MKRQADILKRERERERERELKKMSRHRSTPNNSFSFLLYLEQQLTLHPAAFLLGFIIQHFSLISLMKRGTEKEKKTRGENVKERKLSSNLN